MGRRTKKQTEQLEAQIHEVCRNDRPVSVRHVFYRMTDVRLPEPVEKTEHAYKQVVNRMKQMRLGGRLPYHWVTDASRMGYHVFGYEDIQEFVRDQAGQFRYDMWRHQEVKVEVWCESQSIAGMILPECQRLGVSLYPCRGFPSLSYTYAAAKGYVGDTHIVYVGDYDPAGMMIGENLIESLCRHTDHEVSFERIAVNEIQIAMYDLPAKPRKPGERRRPDMKETVEAEAMPASLLRDLVRREVESFLPDEAISQAREVERSANDYLRIFSMDQPLEDRFGF